MSRPCTWQQSKTTINGLFQELSVGLNPVSSIVYAVASFYAVHDLAFFSRLLLK